MVVKHFLQSRCYPPSTAYSLDLQLVVWYAAHALCPTAIFEYACSSRAVLRPMSQTCASAAGSLLQRRLLLHSPATSMMAGPPFHPHRHHHHFNQSTIITAAAHRPAPSSVCCSRPVLCSRQTAASKLAKRSLTKSLCLRGIMLICNACLACERQPNRNRKKRDRHELVTAGPGKFAPT